MFTLQNQVGLDQYAFDELSQQNGLTYEEEITGRLNFRVPFSIIENQKGRLRFGGKARLKFKKRENDFFSYEPTENFMDNLGQTGLVNWNGRFNPNSAYAPGLFASNTYLGNLNLNAPSYDQSSEPSEFLSSNYSANEKIYAGYLRWDQNFTDQLSMIVGVRVENTQIDYTGNVVEDEENLTGSRSIESQYTNWLPSIAFKYAPDRDLVLRVAYSTALARPSYFKISPYVNILPNDRVVSAGNPDLKASYAHNYDVMGEYYFKSVGILSLGGFYKKINNFIYDYRDQSFNREKFAQMFPDISNTLEGGQNYTLVLPQNGESVQVYGFEAAVQRQLDFLPGFLSHFGVYLNYTYTKSKAKGVYNADGDLRTNVMLPGTAPHMFNSSLSWESKKFTARLSLNHTAAYLDEFGSTDFDDRYYDKQTFVDANVSYALTSFMRVFAEANNLTNQPLRYYQGEKNRTMQMEYYMPRYTLGLKFDF